MALDGVNSFTKPRGSGNDGKGGNTIIINKGGNGGFNPNNCNIVTLSAHNASIDNLTVTKGANIDNANIRYFMSSEGTVTKIDGRELNYSYGFIDDLTTNSFSTDKLTVKSDANIKKIMSEYINANEITTDNLTVTRSAHFFELIIDKIRSIQGTQINTAANCIADYVEAYHNNTLLDITDPNFDPTYPNTTHYRIYFKSTEEDGEKIKSITNDWLTYDQAICESFNVDTGTSHDVSNKYYWRLVNKTSKDTGESIRYINFGTDEVKDSDPGDFSITFTHGFQYGDNYSYSYSYSYSYNYTYFDINDQIEGEYDYQTNTFTPSTTIYGLEITPRDADKVLSGGSFIFNTDKKTKLNIGVYYDDGTFNYFQNLDPDTQEQIYSTDYVITTDPDKNAEAFVINTGVIDKWDPCHWIDLSNSVKDDDRSGKNAIPSIGDNICQLGYRYNMLPDYVNTQAWMDNHKTEVARASAIIIAAYDTPDNGDPEHNIDAIFPPSYAQYQKIITFDLASKRGTYFDATGAYVKGNLVTESGTKIDITDQGFSADIEYYGLICNQTPIVRPTGENSYVDINVLHILNGSGALMTKAELDGWYITVNGSNPIYRDSLKDNPGCFTFTVTNSSPDNMNISLFNPNNVMKDNIIVSVIDLTSVKDGVDGDYYEFIYITADEEESVTRSDLPASLNKKFNEYTSAEKDGWSQSTPSPFPNEYVWMSNRSITHEVVPYDPSVVTNPVILTDKESLVLEIDPNSTTTATLKVNGHLLTENVAVTLTDTNNVFSIDKNSLNYEAVNNDGVTLTLTFAPSAAGNYTANIALSSTGADTVNVTVIADASTGDTASDNYLNVKKNGSISTVGWDQTKVNYIYKYTEYPDYGEAWLTMPVYGAFSAIHENYPQAWIDTNVTFDTSTSITTGGWQIIADDIFLGSDEYFTTTTAKSVGAEALLSSTGSNVSFIVTNVTAVKLYGHNRTWTGTASHPMSITVYECTVSGGTVTPASTYTYITSNSGKDTDVLLSINGLEINKVYKIVVSEERGTMYEVGFCTPISKNSPIDNQYTQIANYNAWSTPIRITGENGQNGVDGDGIEYIYYITQDDDTPPPLYQTIADLPYPSAASASGHVNESPLTGLIDRWESYENGNWVPHDSTKNDYLPISAQTEQGSYFSTLWTDEPSGVNEAVPYEWVSVRKYDGDAKQWGEFSEPVVWSHYGEDGAQGPAGQNGQNGQNGADGKNAFNNVFAYSKAEVTVTVSGQTLSSITSELRTNIINLQMYHIENNAASLVNFMNGGYTLCLDVITFDPTNSQSFIANSSTTQLWTVQDGTTATISTENLLNILYPESVSYYRDYLKLQEANVPYLPIQLIIYMKDSSDVQCTDKLRIDINMQAGYINQLSKAGLYQAFFGSYSYGGQTINGMSTITANMNGIATNVQSLTYSYNALSSDYTTFKQTSYSFQTTATQQLSYVNGELSNIDGDINTINGELSNIDGDINTINGNIITIQSQITQMPGQISAQVKTDIAGELRTTGIDITDGKIDLNALTTNVNGNLAVNNTGDGITLYDVNDQTIPRVQVVNKTVGDITDNNLQSALSASNGKYFNRPENPGQVTVSIPALDLGTFTNNPLTLSKFSGHVGSSRIYEITDATAQLWLGLTSTSTASDSGSISVFNGALTFNGEYMRFETTSLTSPSGTLNNRYYLLGNITFTFYLENSLSTTNRYLEVVIEGTRGILSDQKIQMLGNDGAVFKQTEQRYAMFGPSFQQMRYDNSIIRNDQNGLLVNQHGIKHIANNISYDVSTTLFGSIDTLPYLYISNNATDRSISQYVGLVCALPGSGGNYVALPDPALCPTGKQCYVANVDGANTLKIRKTISGGTYVQEDSCNAGSIYHYICVTYDGSGKRWQKV